MFANISKQIYTKLVKQDFKPFRVNINENINDKTIYISLIKNVDTTIYILNLLNVFEYKPEYCLDITSNNSLDFKKRYEQFDIITVNVFISNDNFKTKSYIDNIKEDKILDFKNIYWGLYFEDDKAKLYFNKKQPNKIIGIEKVLLSSTKDYSEEQYKSLKNITKDAFDSAPLIEKNKVFNFYNLIIIINTIIFFYMFLTVGVNTKTLYNSGAFSYYDIVNNKEYYRIFTAMFLHANFAHVFSNMATLYIFGRGLERTTSHSFFLIVYFLSGIIANVLMLLIPSNTIMVGASGCIFGVLGATLMLTFLFNKSISNLSFYSIFAIAVINLFFSLSSPEISFSVHFIGFIVGLVLGCIYFKVFNNRYKN